MSESTIRVVSPFYRARFPSVCLLLVKRRLERRLELRYCRELIDNDVDLRILTRKIVFLSREKEKNLLLLEIR